MAMGSSWPKEGPPEPLLPAESPLVCEMSDNISLNGMPAGGTAGSRAGPATFLPPGLPSSMRVFLLRASPPGPHRQV